MMSIKPTTVNALVHLLTLVHPLCTMENSIVCIIMVDVDTMRLHICLKSFFVSADSSPFEYLLLLEYNYLPLFGKTDLIKDKRRTT